MVAILAGPPWCLPQINQMYDLARKIRSLIRETMDTPAPERWFQAEWEDYTLPAIIGTMEAMRAIMAAKSRLSKTYQVDIIDLEDRVRLLDTIFTDWLRKAGSDKGLSSYKLPSFNDLGFEIQRFHELTVHYSLAAYK